MNKKFEIIKDKFTHTELDNTESESNIKILTVPNNSLITKKFLDEFKTNSFSGPLKTHVSSAMDKSIAEEKKLLIIGLFNY